MKKNIYPKPLYEGDKIAIVSPSGAVDEKYVHGAAKRLQEWGFVPVISDNALNSYGRYGATIEQRVADLQQAVDDEEIKAILCSRGGYGVVQIIDKINLKPLLSTPKWLIGFSDITVFHAALSNLEIPSIHGIMARNLTENNADDKSVTMLHDILKGDKPHYKLDTYPLNRMGTAQGILVGGNLSVLAGLRGTKYDINFKNKPILFIEDIGEQPYHIDRMMYNLKLGGVLENVSGLIVGQFTDMEEDPLMYKTVDEIILDAVAGYDYPVWFDFPAGHIDSNWPLIMGADVTMNVNNVYSEIKWE